MSLLMRSNFGHQFSSSALPALDEIFDSELAQHPSRRGDLFKIESMDRDITQYSEVHDLDLFEQLNEGQEYSFRAPKQGASKTFTAVKYGLGFKITEEMVEDGKFGWIQDAVRKLAKSARESQEVSAMNVINNGFGSETTADGVSVFNSAHTLPSGGTYRNVLSTASDLSPTALDTMLSDFETQFVGDSGIIYNIRPKVLWCHPSNRRYALELIGSDLKADTADNNMNALKSEGLRVVSSPHFSDSDAWGLASDPMDNGLRIYIRKALETKAAGQDSGFKDDSIHYKARYREVLGAVNAYGLFGTPGA